MEKNDHPYPVPPAQREPHEEPRRKSRSKSITKTISDMKEEEKNPTDEQLKEAFSALSHVDAEQIHQMFQNAPKKLNDVILKAQKTEQWDCLMHGVIADRNKAFRMAVLAMAAFTLWALILIVEPRFGIIKDFLELPVFLFLIAFVFVALYRLSKKDGLARHLTMLSYLNSEDGVEWRKYLRDNFGYEVKPLDEDKSH